jgi:hypothetical protein
MSDAADPNRSRVGSVQRDLIDCMRRHERIVCIANEFSRELEQRSVVTAPRARHRSLLETASDDLELMLCLCFASLSHSHPFLFCPLLEQWSLSSPHADRP